MFGCRDVNGKESMGTGSSTLQEKDRYEKNGWKRGIFYLENGHAEFRRIMDLVEKFDV